MIASTTQAESQARATAVIEAQTQRDKAQRQSRISLARELVARSSNQVSRDGDAGLLLAVEAVKVSKTLGPNAVPEAATAS